MRVAVVGIGAVGETCAHALVASDVARRLLLLNRTVDTADAIARDLRQARAWGRRLETSFENLTTPDTLVGYELVVVTLGRRLFGSQSRADVAQETAQMLRDSGVVERLREVAGSETAVLVVSNPVELMVTWLQEETGISSSRLFGLGTTVESARLSQHLAGRLDVDADSVWVHVLGEHGPQFVLPDSGRLGSLESPEALTRGLEHARLRTLEDAKSIRGISEEIGRRKAQDSRRRFAGQWPEAPDEALQQLEDELSRQLAPPATRFAIAAAVVEVARAVRNDADRVMTLSALRPASLDLPEVALSLPFAVRRSGLGRCVLHTVPAGLAEVANALHADYRRLQADLGGGV